MSLDSLQQEILNTKEVVNRQNNKSALYLEIKENETNSQECMAAKEKEIERFKNYNAYEEIPFEGQTVLGTRFVLN